MSILDKYNLMIYNESAPKNAYNKNIIKKRFYEDLSSVIVRCGDKKLLFLGGENGMEGDSKRSLEPDGLRLNIMTVPALAVPSS